MKKIILSQNLEYDDQFTPSFNWPYNILIKLIENKSELIASDGAISSHLVKRYEYINNTRYSVYEDYIDHEAVIEYNENYYYFNYYADHTTDFRENVELISLLENNPELCLDNKGNIIFRILEIPDDLTFEIKRIHDPINGINSRLIEKEYIVEVLKNPRIYGK